MKVKTEGEVAQLCPTLWDPMDCSPPGSSVHGIFPGKSTGMECHCLLPGATVEYPNRHVTKFWDIRLSEEEYLG